MPYTGKQKALFQGVKHGSIPAKKGLTPSKASELLSHDKKKPATAAARLTGK